MNFYQELDMMFIGKPSMLTSKQKRMLKRLVHFPTVSKFAFMAVGLLVGLTITAEAIINIRYDDGQIATGEAHLAAIAAVLVIIGVGTRLYCTTVLKSNAFTDIADKAVKEVFHAKKADLYGLKMDQDRKNTFRKFSTNPLFLCDFYHINRRGNYGIWVLVIAAIVLIGGYIPRFMSAHDAFEARVAVITETQKAIEAEYSDICNSISITDPHEYRNRSEYTVHAHVSINNMDRVGIAIYVSNEGKITGIYLTARFDEEKTAEENIDYANDYFSQFYDKADNLKDMFESEGLLEYKYQIEGDFAKDVIASYGKDKDVSKTLEFDADEGLYRIYQSFYGKYGNLHISPYYHSYQESMY